MEQIKCYECSSEHNLVEVVNQLYDGELYKRFYCVKCLIKGAVS